jgi:hypothetical protein
MNMTTHDTSPHAAPRDGERLLSRREIAARWGCCTRTVARLEAAGLLKPVRFNSRNIRYTLSNVTAAERAAKGGE